MARAPSTDSGRIQPIDPAVLATVRFVVAEALGLDDHPMTADTELLGSLPEFDSMAVVAILTALEERYGFEVADDDVTAASFETVGTLCHFVEGRLRT